jgi:hypothetical protein
LETAEDAEGTSAARSRNQITAEGAAFDKLRPGSNEEGRGGERGAMNDMQFIAYHSSLVVHPFHFKSASVKQTFAGLLRDGLASVPIA